MRTTSTLYRLFFRLRQLLRLAPTHYLDHPEPGVRILDGMLADKEGWCISECWGSVDGEWQLQRDDEANVFEYDDDAWAHVLARARAGSKPHRRALAFIQANNPDYFDMLIETADGLLNPTGSNP